MAEKKPKRTRGDRSDEYRRRKAAREAAAKQSLGISGDNDQADYRESQSLQSEKEKQIDADLVILSKQTANNATDADRDIDFAYRMAGNPALMPLDCPSLGAWQWYVYARTLSEKFLEICAKREDAKTKAAGTITSQRMEDDKRQKFAILDRIERQLTVVVSETVGDLMQKFPEDVLHECRKHKEAWDAYFAKFPL